MADETKIQTTFSDEDFAKLPDAGTFGAVAPAAQEPQSLLGGAVTLKYPQGPPGGWMKAAQDEVFSLPKDAGGKAMVDSAKAMAALGVMPVTEAGVVGAETAGAASMARNAIGRRLLSAAKGAIPAAKGVGWLGTGASAVGYGYHKLKELVSGGE